MNEQGARTNLREALETIRPLVTMSRDGLVITALEGGVGREPAYETATAAAGTGSLELREQGSGTVPTIEAVTKTKPVVIFAGDTVVGGKQNRIINITVWLPAAAVTAIPVSCLEHGRWNQGHQFAASRKVDYSLRAKMSEQLANVARVEQAQAAASPGACGGATVIRGGPGPGVGRDRREGVEVRRPVARRPPCTTSTSARRSTSRRSSGPSPAPPEQPASPSGSAGRSSLSSCSTRPPRSPSSGRA